MKIKGLIALTGRSGGGKTLACELFKDRGIPVINGDKTARWVQRKGSACLSDLVGEFSSDILLPNGELDRKKLGAMVFADPEKLLKLNSIVHPYVVAAIVDSAKKHLETSRFCIVEAPTLIESGLVDYCDRIVFIDAAAEKSVERIMTRDSLEHQRAIDRISSQLKPGEYRRISDLVIENNGTIGEFLDKLNQAVRIFESWYE